MMIVGVLAVLSPSALGANVAIAVNLPDPGINVAPPGHDYSYWSCLHYGWSETGYDFGGFFYFHSQAAVQSCDNLWVHTKISNPVPLVEPHVRARAWGGYYGEYVPTPAFWQARVHLWGCLEAWMSDAAAAGTGRAALDVTFTVYNWERNADGVYTYVPEMSHVRHFEVHRTSGSAVKLPFDNLIVDLQGYSTKSGYKQFEISAAADVSGAVVSSGAAVAKVGACDDEGGYLRTWVDYVIGDRTALP